MIYVIVSEQDFLLKQEIKKIKEKHEIDNEDVMNVSNLHEMIQQAISLPLFSDRKLVLYENAEFLTSKAKNDDMVEVFDKYIENPNNSTILILTTKEIDNRKKIVKKLKKYANFKELISLTIKTKKNYINERLYIHKVDIVSDAKNMFMQFLPLDANIIENEIIKLKQLQMKITKEIVIEYTTEYYEDNAFTFLDIFLNQDVGKTLEYYNRIKKPTEIMKFIGLFASNIRLTYQVSTLSNLYSQAEIVKLLQVNPYRVQLAYKQIYKKKSLHFLRLLASLEQLSFDIRHGNVEPLRGFELFLIKEGNL